MKILFSIIRIGTLVLALNYAEGSIEVPALKALIILVALVWSITSLIEGYSIKR